MSNMGSYFLEMQTLQEKRWYGNTGCDCPKCKCVDDSEFLPATVCKVEMEIVNKLSGGDK